MYNSEDTRTLHFGFGNRGCDYTIEVRWPNGATASFTPDQVAENSFMRLTYPDQLKSPIKETSMQALTVSYKQHKIEGHYDAILIGSGIVEA